MKLYVEDTQKNRAYIKKWGTREAAEASLKTLIWCRGCIDCENCVQCSHCKNCKNCANCVDCEGCVNCISCSLCKLCVYSRSCHNCDYCVECIQCDHCKDCTNCIRCNYCVNDANWHKKNSPSGGTQINSPPIVPVVKNIHQKILDAVSYENELDTAGKLDMSAVHTCGTTHCRAGWAIHLAGDAGYKLEEHFGWHIAAIKIFNASSVIPVGLSKFYGSNLVAYENIEQAAKLESMDTEFSNLVKL
jgi:hypothetical protein